MSDSRFSPEVFEVTQEILDSIDPGITVFNSRFELVAWNRAYETMEISEPGTIRRGLTLYENYRNVARRGVFGPGNPEEIADKRWQMLLEGSVPAVEDLHSTDGRIFEIRRYFLPRIGVAAIFTDVTEARRAEERARRAESLALLGRVAGGLAHDFNNLLTVIIGSLEVSGDSGSAVSSNTRLALAAAIQGANLCRTTLALSNPQAPQLEVLSISRCLEEAATFVHRVLPETITIDLRLSEPDCAVRTDKTRLTSAILNLALNSRDAMPDGGTIRIGASVHGDHVRVVVADEGTGMDRETLARVQDDFYSTKGQTGGTGLGLGEVRRFVSESGGRILWSSKPLVGTVVEMFLPTVGQEDLKSMPDAGPDAAIEARALLVEDDDNVRQVVTSMLNRLGARTTAVSTPEQARARLLEESFDVLLTDFLLKSHETGLDLARFARAQQPAIGLILSSGHQDIDIADSGIEMVPLPKPIRLRAVKTALRAALTQQRS